MILQIVGLVVRVGAVLLAAAVAPAFVSESYALSGAVFYTLYLVVILRVVGIPLGTVMRHVRWTLPLVLLAVVAGVFVSLFVVYLVPAVLPHGGG